MVVLTTMGGFQNFFQRMLTCQTLKETHDIDDFHIDADNSAGIVPAQPRIVYVPGLRHPQLYSCPPGKMHTKCRT